MRREGPGPLVGLMLLAAIGALAVLVIRFTKLVALGLIIIAAVYATYELVLRIFEWHFERRFLRLHRWERDAITKGRGFEVLPPKRDDP